MKTNRRVRVFGLLAMGLLVAVLNTKPANAQEFRGKFTFPSPVRWGIVILPAGEYSMVLRRTDIQAHGLLTIFRGTRTVALIPTHYSSATKADRSEILLQDGVVRTLRLAPLELSIEYTERGGARHRLEAQTAQVIPVTTTKFGR